MKKITFLDIFLILLTGGIWLLYLLYKYNKTYFKYTLLAFIGFIVVLFVVSIINESSKSPEQREIEERARLAHESVEREAKENQKLQKEKEKANSNEIAAITFSQIFVKDNLKSPSTAKFGNIREYTANNIDLGKWTVTGYVDSQNSFGAVIRTKYAVTIQYDVKNDKWTLEQINFFE
ncbi:MAG: hypothetical protein KIT33_12115 [Candidatus Kapabacteria bacterium]|nr:hypothetical protein [Ignavibacteriota bacterium]MCW5885705.1 hypothetical protein [Candidatus Kapabacteria bacterium]